MFMKNSIKYLIFGSFVLSLSPANANAYSYSLSAVSVYKQAQAGNYEYFSILQKYPRAIDIMDNSGNTAYCLALRNRDVETMRFLAAQGANTRHSCINRIMNNTTQGTATQRTNSAYRTNQHRFKETGFFDKDENVYYTAAGVAAAGGLIALLASNINSGGSHSSGGSAPQPGPGPEPEPEPVGDLTDMTADEFKTPEYLASDVLVGINAAEAYSHIYQKDEVGNIFGHQAGKTDRIAKIKVGVLDDGTYPNKDLNGDIVKTYNINQYNGANSMWGYVVSPEQAHFVILQDGKYYAATIDYKNSTVSRWRTKSGELALTLDQVRDFASVLGLSFDNNFTTMNAPGGSNPGIDMSDFDYTDLQSWGLPGKMSHGTHVSGIISANKNNEGIHGVAFDNAQLYVATWDLIESTNITSVIKDMVDNGVSVINNSWGKSRSKTASDFVNDYNSSTKPVNHPVIDAFVYAANRGAVWVQAAGNEGLDDADYWAGMRQVDLTPEGYSGPGQYEVPYISVAALDLSTASSLAPSGKIADYSNRCGTAKDYCISAPGSNIESTAAVDSGDIYMDGTSMGTPAVTGSIALLNGYYPWLSAQNVAYLLLETANSEGEYSNSAVYGKGALDLQAAVTKPIGELGLSSNSDINSLQPAKANKLYLTGITQAQIAKSLPKTITAFDALHRPFEYKTENLVSQTHGSNLNFRNKVSHAALGGAKKTIKDEKTGFSFSQTEALNKGGKQNLSSVEIIHEADDGSATRLYYADNSKYMSTENVLTPSNNPYLTMNETYGAENTLRLSDVSKLKLSLQTGENGMYERDYEQDSNTFTDRSYAINAEYNFNLTDYLELSTLGGMLFEENAMLGMNGQGGFAIKDGSTYYMGLKAALNLTSNFSLLAAYYRGYTKGQDATMLALSDIETESYMLAAEYKLTPLHKIGLSLASPLSVVKGKASFRYASGRDNYSDTVYMQKLTSSLKPSAKEYDLGLYYQGTPESNLNILGKVETRFNADGEKGLTDYLGIMGMQYAFPK